MILEAEGAVKACLKGWMFKFKGVATAYLDNYLGWHRMMDRADAETSDRSMVAASLARH